MAKDPDTGLLAQNESTVTAATTLDAKHSHTDSKLPMELYSRIINHIDDKTTLLSMLVLSKPISGDAERKLHNNIKFSDPQTHSLFLKSILDPKREHLARHVHRYYLFRAPVYDDSFNALLQRALVTFINLKHLSFLRTYGPPSAKVLPIETLCPFQLHTFKWRQGTHPSHLGPFLNAQHSLEVLSMSLSTPFEDWFSISSTSLQNLWSLSGSIGVILKVQKGRSNITHLHWEPFSRHLDVSITPSFSHIRILSFGIVGTRPVLGGVILLLGHIEILELGRFDESELVDLYKLARLRTLVLSYNNPGSRYPGADPQENFHEMKNLELIDLVDGWSTDSRHLPTAYQRWNRDAQESVVVNVSEAVWWREIEI